jgi:DNA-binding winged helix-turn-helix (wHTH) protein
VPLAPKAVETLLVLVENSGRLVEKDNLMKQVWPDTFVEEGNLTANIHLLRKVLGKGPRGQEYIETIPRRGYRFMRTAKAHQEDPNALKTKDIVERPPAQTEEREQPEPPKSQGEEPGSVRLGQAWPEQIQVQKSEAGERALPSVEVVLAEEPRRHQPKPLMTGAMAGAVLVGLFIVWVYLRPKQSLDLTHVNAAVRSIAVLPLTPLNSDADDQYLGLGMTDALISGGHVKGAGGCRESSQH